MKMTVTNTFSDQSKTVDVQFQPAAHAGTQPAIRKMADYLAWKCIPKQPMKNVSEMEEWCHHPKTVPKIDCKPLGISGGTIAKSIVDLLLFDGQVINEAQLWELINGEYYTLFSLADWIVRAFLRKESYEQKT